MGGEGDLVGAGDEEAAALHLAQRLLLALLERVDLRDQLVDLAEGASAPSSTK